MTISKLPTDPPEWTLYDKDLLTVIGILRGYNPSLYLQLNECGTGAITIPLTSPLISYILEPEDALGMFVGLNYRGGFRGGFLVEQHNIIEISNSEYAGQAIELSGRGMLALIEDAVSPDYNTPGNEDIRFFGTKDITSGYGTAPIPKGSILYHYLDDERNGAISAHHCWHVDGDPGGAKLLDWDFTDVYDSNGVLSLWVDAEDMEFRVGTSILDVLKQIAALEYDFTIGLNPTPADGVFLLRAFKNRIGTNKSTWIIFRVGLNCTGVNLITNMVDTRNFITAEFSHPSNPFTEVEDDAMYPLYRRRMSLLQSSNASDSATAANFANAELNVIKYPKQDMTVSVYDGKGPRVFIDYDIGDTVGYSGTPISTVKERRITGLQLSWPGDDKFAMIAVEFMTVSLKDMLTRTALDVRKLSASHSGSALANPETQKVAHGNIIWTVSGANLAAAGVNPLKYRIPYVGSQAKIEEIYAQLGTAPGAANLRVTIKVNGSSIITAGYVQVNIGNTTGAVTTGFLNGGLVTKDQYFQLEIVQGDAAAADLTLHMRYRWPLTVG